jgi:hypothetical protein
MASRVSLAELIDADIPVRPDEAVAILREVCRQHASGELRGIPNASVIRLTPAGQVLIEGPMSRDQDAVRAAAALLGELLPGFQTPGGFKVPGGLRLVLARATRSIDLPPFESVAEFCAALERFASTDPAETVRHLFAEWRSRQTPAPPEPDRELTISDVRRARRATGLPLEDVAQASGIPAVKLRELEWGYVRNWHVNDASRDDLRRYARAAGLDEELVLSVAWPLIESGDAGPMVEVVPSPRATDGPDWGLVPVAPRDAVPVARPLPPRESVASQYRWLLALAAAILLVATAMAIGWERASPVTNLDLEARRTEATDDRRPAADSPVATAGAETAAATEPPVRDARHASLVKPLPRAGTAVTPTRRTKARPAAQPPQKKSFFKRELFRIVIK